MCFQMMFSDSIANLKIPNRKLRSAMYLLLLCLWVHMFLNCTYHFLTSKRNEGKKGGARFLFWLLLSVFLSCSFFCKQLSTTLCCWIKFSQQKVKYKFLSHYISQLLYYSSCQSNEIRIFRVTTCIQLKLFFINRQLLFQSIPLNYSKSK